MSRIRASDQLKALQQRHLELKKSYQQHQQQRRALLLRDGLLNAMCESLSFMQLTLACGYNSQPDAQAEQQEDQAPSNSQEQRRASDDLVRDETKFGELLKSEVELLEQLNDKKELGGQSLAQLLEPEEGTISPCTDPMQYLHRFVSRPPLEDAATMTAEGMATIMQKTVQSISIKLHQLGTTATVADRTRVLDQIAAVWDRYMHAQGSLVMLGRQNILEQAHCTNLETMAYEPAEAAQHQQAQAAMLVPLLGLSDQQQEFIAVGMHLFYDLLDAVYQERQQISSEMTAVETSRRTSSEDANMDGGSPASGGSSEQLGTIPDRQEQLEKQQQLTNRLSLLLHKEYKLRLSGMGWFIGTLTYEQLSRFAVLSYPYPMRVLFLATEVMQQRNAQLQRRQQLS